MDTKTRLLVSITDARKVLGGIGHTTLYDLVNRGEIIKVNIGRRGFITSESLDDYVDRLQRDPAAAGRGVGNLDPVARDARDDHAVVSIEVPDNDDGDHEGSLAATMPS